MENQRELGEDVDRDGKGAWWPIRPWAFGRARRHVTETRLADRKRLTRRARWGTSIPKIPTQSSACAARSPLRTYLIAAVLIRTATGGAAVGLVLLTVSRPDGGGAAAGGLLAALLTAPQLAGPWLARFMEGRADSRIVLACTFALSGFRWPEVPHSLGQLPSGSPPS